MVNTIEETKPNPLVKIYADFIYYGNDWTIDRVPAYLRADVTALLATYPADPYFDDHRHHIADVDGLQEELDSKETPDGAQSKADAALSTAQQYVMDKIAQVVDGSPDALDTLYEIAAALNNDPDFANTVINQLGTKVDKVAGKGLSANDYTDAEKEKLDGIASGANNYVHPQSHPATMISGLSTVATSGSYNDLDDKPTIPTNTVNKSGDTMTGVLTASSNTSYTTRQVRNMVLSAADADNAVMQNGDIWVKYK